MLDIEIELLEEYKKLDNLLKDKFSSEKGVSEYIDKMKQDNYYGESYIKDWQYYFKQLKRVRWLRNNIAHNNGVSDCRKDDVEFLKNFYNATLNNMDPLRLLYLRRKKESQNDNKTHNYNDNSPQSSNNLSLTIVWILLIVFVLLVIGTI